MTDALCFKLSDKQADDFGYPKNSYIAIVGIPPRLEARSSTHLYECHYKDVAKKLAELTGQKHYTN